MMDWYNSTSCVSWPVMVMAMVAFWGLVIFVVVAIFRGVGGPDAPAERAPRRAPLQILDERFARGELDPDEYQARRDALRGTSRLTDARKDG